MAKVWLKVEVAREMLSDVYICVDDSKITRKKLIGGKHTTILMSDEVRRLARQAAEGIDSLDWDEGDIVSVLSAKEVSQAEAEQYGVSEPGVCLDAADEPTMAPHEPEQRTDPAT